MLPGSIWTDALVRSSAPHGGCVLHVLLGGVNGAAKEPEAKTSFHDTCRWEYLIETEIREHLIETEIEIPY